MNAGGDPGTNLMTVDQPSTPQADLPEANLLPALRASLEAKRARLLSRPIIADIPPDSGIVARKSRRISSRRSAWRENADEGTWNVRISLDYEQQWRGREKEILQAVTGMVEQQITFLTDQQRALLASQPLEFLQLNPRPQSAELISFESEAVGRWERVIELELAERPQSLNDVTAVAIVPNLVQIERQLAALGVLEEEADDSPLAPLRALIGLPHAELAETPPVNSGMPTIQAGEDRSQRECIELAMKSPHYSVIHGPPGSGKTTVIAEIVRLCVERGERILIVSPTHVAIDNVVEKLVSRPDATVPDALEPQTLPVRFASRPRKLSLAAMDYWVGGVKQKRGATIARRVEMALRRVLPEATQIFDAVDPDLPGDALISGAVAQCEQVVCGTPIGILSCAQVKDAKAGSFDLMIVDEVSKMTVPEFLAIAVKARRWCVVGDPEQLPPFQDSAENAVTLYDHFTAELEVACSVVSYFSNMRGNFRATTPLLVVARDPLLSARVIQAQLAFDAMLLKEVPPLIVIADSSGSRPSNASIAVCGPGIAPEVATALAPAASKDSSWKRRGRDGSVSGHLKTLVERGISHAELHLPEESSLIQEDDHCPHAIFERMFNVYHAQPWTRFNKQELRMVLERRVLPKLIPGVGTIEASGVGDGRSRRSELMHVTARIFALNALSVFDWLTGIPPDRYDTPPLNLLHATIPTALVQAVRPFVGVLDMQYRMHSSLSFVPRKLFYQGKALRDGSPEESNCRVSLVRMAGGIKGEENEGEAEETLALAQRLDADEPKASFRTKPRLMIITPYRDHEALLNAKFNGLESKLSRLDLEICTLDRCQGREAKYVVINLVTSRPSPFLNMPKRWNVALTRAREGLFIVGNIDAYLDEARRARVRVTSQLPVGRFPLMSLLARIIEEYEQQVLNAAPKGDGS